MVQVGGVLGQATISESVGLDMLVHLVHCAATVVLAYVQFLSGAVGHHQDPSWKIVPIQLTFVEDGSTERGEFLGLQVVDDGHLCKGSLLDLLSSP